MKEKLIVWSDNMKKYLLHIKVLPHPYVHDIWMNSQGNVGSFIKDISGKWLCERYTFDHFPFHVENRRILDNQKTWQENFVCTGDHLILV